MIRVYHPVLNAWQDVRKKDVVKWQRQGWVTEKPAHVDDSDALSVDAEAEGAAADTAPASTTVTAK